MKRKAIHAEYRKTSESFPEWLKYEITVLDENGKTEKIPAYGKDLQDALSRVVHDEKVEKIQKTARVIPWWGWVLTWFGYLGFISYWWSTTNNVNILAGGVLSAMIILVFIMLWSKDRNIDKS